METKTVPFHIESENGHDTNQVPLDKLVPAINEQIEDKKWVAIEKTDGTSEVITEKVEEATVTTEATKQDWKDTFGGKKPVTIDPKEVKSATAVNKLKGG